MEYPGRATNIKLQKKINGTHKLTFQMLDKWFDSEKREYVKNEFTEQIFNEKKIKLYYKEEWIEFYVKTIQDTKNFKSYIKNYTCTDAFIDELSRNGYKNCYNICPKYFYHNKKVRFRLFLIKILSNLNLSDFSILIN